MTKHIVVLVAITTIATATVSVPYPTEARSGSDARSTLTEQYRSIVDLRVEMRMNDGGRYNMRDTKNLSWVLNRANVFNNNNRVSNASPSLGALPIANTEKTPASETTTKKPVVETNETVPKKKESTQQKKTPTVEKVAPVVSDEETVKKVSPEVPSDAFMTVLASEIHRLTNVERARAGVPALAYDNALAQVAKGHSEDMAKRNYFAHSDPEGCNAGCRIDKAGYRASAWGENIAWRSASQLPEAKALAAFFVNQWMNSEGHRRNMLSTSFTHEGVGIARVGNKVFATVKFSRPR